MGIIALVKELRNKNIQLREKNKTVREDLYNKDINEMSNNFKQKLKDCNTLTINTAGGGHWSKNFSIS